jgi:hypothetical protein
MGDFLLDFVGRALKDVRTWASLVTLGFAVAGSVQGHGFLLPTWVWGVAAVLSAYAMTLKAELQLYLAKKARLTPDMTLETLIKRIVGTESLFTNGNPAKVGIAFREIRNHVHLKDITVWGRRNVESADLEFYPLSEVAHEYWEDFAINYLRFVYDQKGKPQYRHFVTRPAVIRSNLTCRKRWLSPSTATAPAATATGPQA